MAALKFVRSVSELPTDIGLAGTYNPQVWESLRANSGLESRLLDGFLVTAASPGRVNFKLPIQKEHTNRLGTLHGGTVASMVDLGGSLALASRGLFSTGVSTDLNVTYLDSGGMVGDLIRGEAVCDKLGKTLAFTSVKFTGMDGKVVARGSHTKYVALAQKDPRNMVDEMDPEKTSEGQTRAKDEIRSAISQRE